MRCPGCELIAQERDLVPEGRAGYGVKVALLPRQAYEALHRSADGNRGARRADGR
ncbi:hypothetical protein [Streptomyces sp. UG1]|uniref:hypothetical protein n=1 Tax=Streptomyces sp. UG1 TaxID=3417652 RepID=UPI003CFA22D1